MKVSKYNVVIPSPKDPKVQLLYNTLYDHQLIISDGEYRLLDLFDKIANHKPLNADEKKGAEQLKELGIIVEDAIDETEEFEKWFTEKIQESKELLTATIFTTLNCNLRCTYCIEKDVIKQAKMNRHTANQTVKWLTGKICSKLPKKVHLEFFGGEPLLNLKALNIISNGIKNICRSLNIEYVGGVITNGVMLTPKIADLLLEAGITKVKVTLDGDKEAHDKKRIYADKRGTFDRIFKNLEDNAGKFKIMIGGNFDEENLDAIPRLIELLKNCKFKDDIVHVSFKPIIKEFGHKNHDSAAACEISSFSEQDLTAMFELRELVEYAGLPTFEQISIGPCEFYRRNSFNIDIDGNIYKCAAFVGREEFIAGDVSSEDFTKEGEKELRMKPWRLSVKCRNCPYLPICAGGCRATAWNDSGDLTTVSCDKKFFDMMVRKAIAKHGFASGPAEK